MLCFLATVRTIYHRSGRGRLRPSVSMMRTLTDKPTMFGVQRNKRRSRRACGDD